MSDLGSAYVQIVPSAKGISGAIADVLEPESKSAGMTAGTTVGQQIGSFAKKAVVALGVGKAISDSVTKGMDFQEAMTKTSTLFTGTADEFESLQSRILSVSSATGMAASELAEAAYSAESASVPMGNLGDMIEGSSKLAVAGFTDVDTALSATAKTMNAYGMMSDDVAETNANMEKVQRVLIQTQNKGITTVGELGASLAQVTPTAASFGVSFEQVGAALAGMTAQGTPTAQATTQLNAMIAELGKSGTKASQNFAKLTSNLKAGGLTFAEAMDSGMDLQDVLDIMQKGADEAGVSMVDMFSSIEAGKAALSINNSDWVDNMAAMATEADVVGEAYGTMSDTMQMKVEQLKMTLQNMGIQAFLAVADGLMGFLSGLGTVLTAIQPALSALGTALMDLGSAIASELGAMLGLGEGMSLTGVISAVLTNLLNLLTTAIGFITDHIDILLPIVSGLIAAFTALKVIKTITTLVQGVGAAFTLLTSPVGLVVAAIAGAIAIGILLYKNWDTIKEKAAELWGHVVDVFENIKAGISEKVEAAKTAVTTAFNGIKTGISTAINAAKTVVNTVVTGIKTALSFSGFSAKVKGVFNKVKTAITSPIEAAKTAVGTVVNGIKGLFNFTVSLPHIPTPHFSISPAGWSMGDLLHGSIPHLGISWYAEGGIFDRPSVIGVGEAGKEAAVPLDPFWNRLEDEFDKHGSGATVNNYITVNGAKDPAEYAATLARQIKLELKRA